MSFFRTFLYVSTVLLLLGSMYIGNFYLDDLIPKELSEFKARVQITKLSTTVIRLSKDLMELKKEKEAYRGTKNAKQTGRIVQKRPCR